MFLVIFGALSSFAKMRRKRTRKKIEKKRHPYRMGLLGRQVPLSSALEGGVKGHNIKGRYLTGKPRALGRGASFRLIVLKKRVPVN
jgi:hypothetical protein